jgi:hypothetical protein
MSTPTHTPALKMPSTAAQLEAVSAAEITTPSTADSRILIATLLMATGRWLIRAPAVVACRTSVRSAPARRPRGAVTLAAGQCRAPGGH